MKFLQVETMKDAKKEAPEAEKVIKVTGGYIAFETIAEYETWKNQK